MDRLVCGDVGFGKTEVAMRAAYIATKSYSQVAVIAPTTILARQHYQTFKKRFTGEKSYNFSSYLDLQVKKIKEMLYRV